VSCANDLLVCKLTDIRRNAVIGFDLAINQMPSPGVHTHTLTQPKEWRVDIVLSARGIALLELYRVFLPDKQTTPA
jgi:hypothetical protein